VPTLLLLPPLNTTWYLQLCKECFYQCLEDEVHHTIVSNSLFKPGERVAVAASGGKDSTVLAHLMTLLNERHK
jgi:cytoplasmic tRNA 2-thiolation protein 1